MKLIEFEDVISLNSFLLCIVTLRVLHAYRNINDFIPHKEVKIVVGNPLKKAHKQEFNGIIYRINNEE